MFFEQKDNGIILRVRLMPNSCCCKVSDTVSGANGEIFLKIHVTSIAEKGKANKELVEFLSKRLKIAKSTIQITSGELDRWKRIFIPLTPDLESKLIDLTGDK